MRGDTEEAVAVEDDGGARASEGDSDGTFGTICETNELVEVAIGVAEVGDRKVVGTTETGTMVMILRVTTHC